MAAKEHRRIGNFYLSPYGRKNTNRIGQFTYLLIARSISYTDIGIQFVGEALEYGRVEIFATISKFVDGSNRSFDESLIAARTPTLFQVSSFFFFRFGNFISWRAKLMRI